MDGSVVEDDDDVPGLLTDNDSSVDEDDNLEKVMPWVMTKKETCMYAGCQLDKKLSKRKVEQHLAECRAWAWRTKHPSFKQFILCNFNRGHHIETDWIWKHHLTCPDKDIFAPCKFNEKHVLPRFVLYKHYFMCKDNPRNKRHKQQHERVDNYKSRKAAAAAEYRRNNSEKKPETGVTDEKPGTEKDDGKSETEKDGGKSETGKNDGKTETGKSEETPESAKFAEKPESEEEEVVLKPVEYSEDEWRKKEKDFETGTLVLDDIIKRRNLSYEKKIVSPKIVNKKGESLQTTVHKVVVPKSKKTKGCKSTNVYITHTIKQDDEGYAKRLARQAREYEDQMTKGCGQHQCHLSDVRNQFLVSEDEAQCTPFESGCISTSPEERAEARRRKSTLRYL